MTEAVRQEQEAEIFLAELGDLVVHRRVGIESLPTTANWTAPRHDERLPTVGRAFGGSVELNFALCLAAVNDSLRAQAKPEIRCSAQAMYNQLRQAGRLLDATDQPLPRDDAGESTRTTRISGVVRRSFRIRAAELFPPPSAVSLPEFARPPG